MAAKLKKKGTSITTMGAKIQAFDIFQTPLSSQLKKKVNTNLKGYLILSNKTKSLKNYGINIIV
jgi:hypothetical protein